MSTPIDPRTTIRQTMDQIDEFFTPRKDPTTFGQKTEPSDAEIEQSKDRRLQDVTSRANAEKKSYGFLRSLKHKVFGKKEEPKAKPFTRPERSAAERKAAIIVRAKKQ